jgi:hypothetical protein
MSIAPVSSERQPPSLKEMTSNVVFTLTYNTDRFVVTRDVTFQHYVYPVYSERAMIAVVIPPDFPYITLTFRYNLLPPLLPFSLFQGNAIACLCVPTVRDSWIRSGLSTVIETGCGARFVRSLYLFQSTVVYMGRRILIFQTTPSKNQNSKFSPCENSKL